MVPAVLPTMVQVERAIADQGEPRTADRVAHDTMALEVLRIMVLADLLMTVQAVQHIRVPVDLATPGRAELAIQGREVARGARQIADEKKLRGSCFRRHTNRNLFWLS
jgi:hypothetical protein